nr:hypothetical protein [uncultured Draconibacterium sp.]
MMPENDKRPKVTIHLDPVLEAYCRYIFKTPPNQDEIVINRKLREGKAIYSKVLPVEFPKRRTFCENPVTFVLPLTRNNQSYLKYRFYAVSKMGEEQIADDLEVLMDKWTLRIFERGYSWNFKQEQIVNGILRLLNVRKNAINFETVKKFDYRNRRREEEDRIKLLLEAS